MCTACIDFLNCVCIDPPFNSSKLVIGDSGAAAMLTSLRDMGIGPQHFRKAGPTELRHLRTALLNKDKRRYKVSGKTL